MQKRAAGGVKNAKGFRRWQTVNDDPSMTVQSDAHLADINTIVRQFEQGGGDLLDEAALEFADISDFTDLKDALDQLRLAEVEFMKLPSKVREIFNHDAAEWLDTAHDQEKRDALVTAGFLEDDSAVQEGGSGEAEPPPEAPAEEPV